MSESGNVLTAAQLISNKEKLESYTKKYEQKLKDLGENISRKNAEWRRLNEQVKRLKKTIKKKDDRLRAVKKLQRTELNKANEVRKFVTEAITELSKDGGASFLESEDAFAFLAQELEEIYMAHADPRGIAAMEKERNKIKRLTIILDGFEFQDSASFRVSDKCTFDQLLSDACLYFSRKKSECTLRDEYNEIWPRQTLVQPHIEELLKKKGDDRDYFPQFRLVSRNKAMLASTFRVGAVSKDATIREETGRKRAEIWAAAQKKILDDQLKIRNKVYDLQNHQNPLFFHQPDLMNYTNTEMVQKMSWNTGSSRVEEYDFEHLIMNRLELRLLWFLVHVGFIVAVAWSLFDARGQVLEFNDMRAAHTSAIRRPFSVTSSVEGSLADSVSMTSLQTVDHVWTFLRDPVLSVLIPDETSVETASATHANQILGAIEIRQVRMASTLGRSNETKCRGASEKFPLLYWSNADASSAIVNSHVRCYNAYTYQIEDRTGYWNTSVPSNETSQAYAYANSGFDYVRVDSVVYEESGYSLSLGSDRATIMTRLSELQSTGWIDDRTRAVFVAFNLLNRNYQNILSGILTIKLSVSGAIRAYEELYLWRATAYAYGSSANSTRFLYVVFCDVVRATYGLMLLVNVLRGAKLYTLKKYIETLWHNLDIVLVVLIVLSFSFRLYFSASLPNSSDGYDTSTYSSLIDHSVRFQRTINCDLAIFLVASVNTLKYFQLNASISKIYRIFVVVRRDLVTILFIVMLTIFALSSLVYLVLGYQISAYRNFSFLFLDITCSVLGISRMELFHFDIGSRYVTLKVFINFFVTCVLQILLVRTLLLALFLSGIFRMDPHRHGIFAVNVSPLRPLAGEERLSLTVRTRYFWKAFFLGPIGLIQRAFREGSIRKRD